MGATRSAARSTAVAVRRRCDESCSRDAADGVVGVVGEIEAGAGRGGRCWGWQWDLSSLRVVEGQLIAACVGSRRKKRPGGMQYEVRYAR